MCLLDFNVILLRLLTVESISSDIPTSLRPDIFPNGLISCNRQKHLVQSDLVSARTGKYIKDTDETIMLSGLINLSHTERFYFYK